MGEISKGKFNIICVTKQGDRYTHTQSHLRISGEAELIENSSSNHGIETINTMIKFQKELFFVKHVRQGLSGLAMAFIVTKPGDIYETWVLYTDIPVAPDTTRESIFEELRRTSERRCY